MDRAILEDLRKAYESGQLIAFVGAGVSLSGGLPSWKGLAQRLLESARGRATPEEVEEIEELISGYRLLEAVSASKHILRRDFEREVIKALDDGPIPDEPEAAKAIAALGPRLWAVITTNLDRFLERSFGGRWDALTDPPGNLAQQNRYILKIHGTLRDARTWVFTREQYDKAMYASPQLQATIGALYRTHPFLFVGFGLEDDNIDLTLGQVRALSGEQPPTHYALFPKGFVRPSRRRSLEDAGVRLIEYPAPNNDHSKLVEVLRWLAAPAGTPVPGDGPVAAPATGSVTAPVTARLPSIPDLPVVEPSARPSVEDTAPDIVNVFISHTAQDHELLERLVTQLSQLVKREKLISIWYRGMTDTLDDIDDVNNERLDAADLYIMLLSADYLDSDQLEAERERALRRYNKGALKIMAVLLRPCIYSSDGKKDKFMGAGVFPRKPGQPDPVPVVNWTNQEEAFLSLAQVIRSQALKMRPSR